LEVDKNHEGLMIFCSKLNFR